MVRPFRSRRSRQRFLETFWNSVPRTSMNERVTWCVVVGCSFRPFAAWTNEKGEREVYCEAHANQLYPNLTGEADTFERWTRLERSVI